MKIAYVMRAHAEPGQLVRLVHALRYPGARFYIHVDRKVSERPFRTAFAGHSGEADVSFVEDREKVYWGGLNMVKATLNVLRSLVRGCAPDKVDYVCLLSGQDYPLRSNREIIDYLDRHKGREFVSHARLPIPFWQEGGFPWLNQYNFWDFPMVPWPLTRDQRILDLKEKVLRRLLRTVQPLVPSRGALPGGLTPYGGAAWWILSLSCIEFTLGYVDRNPELLRRYRFTTHAEESFFQTVVMNSHFSERVLEPALEEELSHDLWYVRWKGDRPEVLRTEDLPALIDSGKLFGRKFDARVDERVLNELDQHRRGA